MTANDLVKFQREKFVARIAGFFVETKQNYFDHGKLDTVIEYWGGQATFRDKVIEGAYKGAPLLIQAELQGDLSSLMFGDMEIKIVTEDSDAEIFARCVHKIEAEGRAMVNRRMFSNAQNEIIYNLEIRNMGTSLTPVVSFDEFSQFADDPQLCLIRADLVQRKERRIDDRGNTNKRRTYQLQNFQRVERPARKVVKDKE